MGRGLVLLRPLGFTVEENRGASEPTTIRIRMVMTDTSVGFGKMYLPLAYLLHHKNIISKYFSVADD